MPVGYVVLFLTMVPFVLRYKESLGQTVDKNNSLAISSRAYGQSMELIIFMLTLIWGAHRQTLLDIPPH